MPLTYLKCAKHFINYIWYLSRENLFHQGGGWWYACQVSECCHSTFKFLPSLCCYRKTSCLMFLFYSLYVAISTQWRNVASRNLYYLIYLRDGPFDFWWGGWVDFQFARYFFSASWHCSIFFCQSEDLHDIFLYACMYIQFFVFTFFGI
jgi:hypothetical protein